MSPDSGLLTGNPELSVFARDASKSVQERRGYGMPTTVTGIHHSRPRSHSRAGRTSCRPALDLAAGEECTGEAGVRCYLGRIGDVRDGDWSRWLLVVPFPSCPVLSGPALNLAAGEKRAGRAAYRDLDGVCDAGT